MPSGNYSYQFKKMFIIEVNVQFFCDATYYSDRDMLVTGLNKCSCASPHTALAVALQT